MIWQTEQATASFQAETCSWFEAT